MHVFHFSHTFLADNQNYPQMLLPCVVRIMTEICGDEVLWAPSTGTPQIYHWPTSVCLGSQQLCIQVIPALVKDKITDFTDYRPPVWEEAAVEAGEVHFWPPANQHWISFGLHSFSSALLPGCKQLHFQSPVSSPSEVCGRHWPHWTHLWWGLIHLQMGDWQ